MGPRNRTEAPPIRRRIKRFLGFEGKGGCFWNEKKGERARLSSGKGFFAYAIGGKKEGGEAATRWIVFCGLARQSQPGNEESLERLLEMAKMGFLPADVVWFTDLIGKLCRIGATSGAWDFFHAVKDAGGSIEAPVCNALLIGLTAIRDFERMNLLFSEMKGLGVHPDVVTFGILINNLCKFCRLEVALNVFDAMPSPDSAVSPNTIIFNTLIDALCKQEGVSVEDFPLGMAEWTLLHAYSEKPVLSLP